MLSMLLGAVAIVGAIFADFGTHPPTFPIFPIVTALVAVAWRDK